MSRSACRATPELILWNGNKKVIPSAAGFVYVVEQNEGIGCFSQT